MKLLFTVIQNGRSVYAPYHILNAGEEPHAMDFSRGSARACTVLVTVPKGSEHIANIMDVLALARDSFALENACRTPWVTELDSVHTAGLKCIVWKDRQGKHACSIVPRKAIIAAEDYEILWVDLLVCNFERETILNALCQHPVLKRELFVLLEAIVLESYLAKEKKTSIA